MKTETNIRNAVCGVYLLFFVVLNFLPIIASAQWEPNVRLTYNDSTSQLTFNSARSSAASGDYIHIVWEDWRNSGSTNTDIYYIRSTNCGTTWHPEVRLTPIDNNTSSHPCVAISVSYFYVVWDDGQGVTWPNFEIWFKRNSTGNVAVEENNNGEEMVKNKGELSIVPNPFAEFFTIKGHEDRCFRLYDLSGQQIGMYKGDRIGDKLRAGSYFVVSDDKRILPARVVKIR